MNLKKLRQQIKELDIKSGDLITIQLVDQVIELNCKQCHNFHIGFIEEVTYRGIVCSSVNPVYDCNNPIRSRIPSGMIKKIWKGRIDAHKGGEDERLFANTTKRIKNVTNN